MAAPITLLDFDFNFEEINEYSAPILAEPSNKGSHTIVLGSDWSGDISKAVIVGARTPTNKYMLLYIAAGGWSDTKNATITTRPMSQDTSDITLEDTANDFDLPANTKIFPVIPSFYFRYVYQASLGEISSAIKHSKRQTFDNGVPLNPPTYADAATGEAAISSPQNGDSFYATSEGVIREYIAGAWGNSTGIATPNASETVSGKVEIATQAEYDAGTDTGGTGAFLVARPSFIKTSFDALPDKETGNDSSLASGSSLEINHGKTTNNIVASFYIKNIVGTVLSSTTAMWRMQGAAGSAAKQDNAEGTASLDLTETNSPTSTTGPDGTADYAYLLASASSHYLNVATQAALQPGTGAFTGELFIKLTATGQTASLFSKNFGVAGNDGYQFQILSDGTLRFVIDSGAITTSVGTITDTDWHHVAVRRDSSGVFNYFIDGVKDATEVTNATDLDSANNFFIGQQGNGANYFNGAVSDFRWTKGVALSDDIIRLHATAPEYTNAFYLSNLFLEKQIDNNNISLKNLSGETANVVGTVI